MRRLRAHTIRLAPAVIAGLALTLGGGTAGAAPGPSPTTPVQCTISGAGVIVGTPGNDVICGSAGDDTIYGFGGNDQIYAGAGDDVISGGIGDDTVYGGTGTDDLFGDAGLGDRLYAKDKWPGDTLHDPDGAFYNGDWIGPSYPSDLSYFTGPPANYHWLP
jgi:Ca2+-binding RTX toxin-like protein